jgi:hypothetical protein
MAQKKIPKEYREFIKDVKEQGFPVDETSDGFQIRSKDDRFAVTHFHTSESNPTLNVRRTAKRMEKHGFKPRRRY